MSDKENTTVLLPTEVELYVQNLTTFPLEEIGSPKWLVQHEHIEKLNMQAILSANANENEYVKDYLLTFEKMDVLIHELVTVEIWKEKVFPEFLNVDIELKNTFIVYLVLYHEATIANLLETVLYHQEICTSINDAILDLVDYCYRKLTDAVQNSDKYSQAPVLNKEVEASPLEELKFQSQKIEFDIIMKTISIMRYLIDNLKDFPLSVVNRVLNTHDFILLYVQIMDTQIWCRTDKDRCLSKYVEGKWKKIEDNERFQLTKIEGQIWLAIYQMLLSPECNSKYDYTEYKKNQILKIRQYLNEVIVDQIPNLSALQRFLEQLAISQPPAYKADLIIEQVPEIHDKIITRYKGKWREIAARQLKGDLNPSEKDIRNYAKKWADTYNFDVLESLINEVPKCASCGEEATKRCSRCQNEWYCKRECQVKHWSKHKTACNLLFEALQSQNKSS